MFTDTASSKVTAAHLSRTALLYQLSELPGESSQLRGQIPVCGPTVASRAHDRRRDAAGSGGLDRSACGAATDDALFAAASSARHGPTTPSPTSPRSGSSASLSSAASSANTSEPRRSPGQDR